MALGLEWGALGEFRGLAEVGAARSETPSEGCDSVPSATNPSGMPIARGLELAQWTSMGFKPVDEWSDEPYWVHRDNAIIYFMGRPSVR